MYINVYIYIYTYIGLYTYIYKYICIVTIHVFRVLYYCVTISLIIDLF